MWYTEREGMESSWNSHALQVTYTVFGWITFSSWSLGFYPQVILNFFNKRVVGLSFNYVVLNNTKHSLYLIYNASMYFSPVVQMQFREKYGFNQFRDSVSGPEMASWNSIPLQTTYEILGWTSFVSWSISFYPQVILNFRRKSVVGLNLDFVLLNLTKHSSYLIYNVCLYFSPAIQKQYFEKYGYGQMIPVAANDVAFSIHAVLLTAITLFQIVIYDRGTQKVSKIAIGIVSAVWLSAAICFFIALPSHSWLWLISIFNSIQVFMTVIKYIPQAVMNFMRKSTDGFSIGNILLDFLGGVTNYSQMAVQSIDQNSWVNFYGNIGKTLLSLVSIFFDILFMCQHYVLYPAKKRLISPIVIEKEGVEPLIKSSDHSESENV